MTIKKTITLLAALSAASMGLAACGSSDSSGSGDYVVANGSEPQNPLVPANTTENGGGRLVDSIFSGLVYYDADGKVQNEVAESIESNPENTEFKVKLKDSKFSDGTPVTAHSFVDAWNFAVENSLQGAYFFEPIKGFEEGKASMEGLKVVDDKNFTISLSAPEADFTQRLGYSSYFPLPKSALEDIDSFGENPVGNGPYKLESWNHNQDATIVPNDEYEGPRKAQNSGVKFNFYAGMDAAYSDLLAGNLDVLDSIPDSAFSVFKDDLGDRAIQQPAAGFQSFTIADKQEHFSGEEGKLRRQAISHAINREEIVKTIFQGTREPARDFTSPTLPGYSDDIKGSDVLKFDPSKAKELWAQADQISKWDNPKFEIAYNADGGHQAWADAVTNSIKNTLGIDANGKPYPDFKSLRDEITHHTIKTAYRTGWQADYPSVGNFLTPLYATGASSNDGEYSNKDFDAKLKEAAAAKDTAAATKIYNEAQSILFEDLPAIPMWYQATTAGYSQNVHDVTISWKGQPVYYKIAKD